MNFVFTSEAFPKPVSSRRCDWSPTSSLHTLHHPLKFLYKIPLDSRFCAPPAEAEAKGRTAKTFLSCTLDRRDTKKFVKHLILTKISFMYWLERSLRCSFVTRGIPIFFFFFYFYYFTLFCQIIICWFLSRMLLKFCKESILMPAWTNRYYTDCTIKTPIYYIVYDSGTVFYNVFGFKDAFYRGFFQSRRSPRRVFLYSFWNLFVILLYL